MNTGKSGMCGPPTVKGPVPKRPPMPAATKEVTPLQPDSQSGLQVSGKLHICGSEEAVGVISARIVSDRPEAFAESAFQSSLMALKDKIVPLPKSSTFFHYKGGKKMKEVLLNGSADESSALVDNIIVSFITENVAMGQVALSFLMAYESWTNTENLEHAMKLLDFKTKCENQVIRALEVRHKLKSLPGIRVSNAGQVNISGMQQVVNGGGKPADSPINGKGPSDVD